MYKYGYDGKEVKVMVPGRDKDDPNYGTDRCIHLPHQCDDWLIGDADNARLMIKDLQAAIEWAERGTV